MAVRAGYVRGKRETALIEQIARLGESEGLSRIGSRMLALLAIAAAPYTIDALAKALKVSRASISTNGQLLRSLGLIERVARPGDRRDYLQVRGDATDVLLSLGIERLQTMREALRAMRSTTPRRSSAAARMRRIEELYDTLTARLRLELAR